MPADRSRRGLSRSHRSRAVAAGRGGAGLHRHRRMSADRAGCLFACAVASASADLGRRRCRCRTRAGWRRIGLGRLRRRWRFLRRLLRRRRIVFGRCVGDQHHHHRRAEQWRPQFRWIGRFGWLGWIERCRDRHRHRQFDLDHIVFGSDQFLDRSGVDLDLDRTGIVEHWCGFEFGRCVQFDRRGIEFG